MGSVAKPAGHRGILNWLTPPKMKKPKSTRPSVPSSSSGPPRQGSVTGRDGAEGAKNHWAPGYCQITAGKGKERKKSVPLDIGTYNCRTLLHEDRLLEIEEELKRIKWSIIGLSEVRRQGEEITDLESGHIFYHNSSNNGHAGVGFLVHKSLKDKVTDFISINERIAEVRLNLTERTKIRIIQVYAPTSTHSEDEMERFYSQLDDTMMHGPKHPTWVIGDFNGKVGACDTASSIVGRFGFG